MTILAIGAERTRVIGAQLRRGWQGWRPFGRFLAQLSGGAIEVARGLVEAHWDYPVTGRTGESRDLAPARDRESTRPTGYGPTVADDTRVRPRTLNHPPVLAAGSERRLRPAPAGWTIAASRVIELGPEDELPWQPSDTRRVTR